MRQAWEPAWSSRPVLRCGMGRGTTITATSGRGSVACNGGRERRRDPAPTLRQVTRTERNLGEWPTAHIVRGDQAVTTASAAAAWARERPVTDTGIAVLVMLVTVFRPDAG